MKKGEYELLLNANSKTKSWYLWPIIEVAIETCMRRGEILSMEWQHIDFQRRKTLLPTTKNGRTRWVPLNSKTMEIIQSLPKIDNRIFPITDTAFRQAWERLRKRAGIKDLTFHDLRHEGISRVFESGMSIPQVMKISGHKTASQLFRYIQVE